MPNPFDRFDGENPFDKFDVKEPPIPRVTPPKEQKTGDNITGSVRAFARGVPVIGAYLDELNAATGAALDPLIPKKAADFLGIEKLPGKTFGERYEAAVAQQRAMDKAFDAENPIASPAMQIGGGIAGGAAELAALPGTIGAGLFGLGGRSMLGKMALGGTSGGGMGYLHGFGLGEGDIENRSREAQKLGALGVATGAAAPVVGKVVEKAVTKLTGTKPPTLEALGDRANKLFNQAENADVVIPPQSLKPLAQSIQDDIAEAGVDATLHPKALAAFKRIADASNENITLKGLHILRRVVQGAAKSADADERRIAGIIKDHLDDYLTNLKSSDVLMGNAEEGAAVLKQAINLWSRMRKGEMVEDLVERAGNRAGQFTGSGYENALRTEFRRIAQNKKIMRTLSLAEQAAVRKVARGGPITNSLRALGRFAARGPVSASLGGGAGYVVGGPLGPPAVWTAGEIGRQGATIGTSRAARMASELMRRGGPAPVAPGATEGDLLARALLQFSGPARNRLMSEWMKNQFPSDQ